MPEGFVKYTIIIGAILGLVILSQQALVGGMVKEFVYEASGQAKAYISKGSGWALSAIYPKITGEVEKRGDVIKTEAIEQKEKVSEDVEKKVENYFAGVAESVFNSEKKSDCQPLQAP